MAKDEIVLTVAEAHQDDVARPVARVPEHVLKGLGLEQGDIIEIKGKSTTVASVRRAYSADAHRDIIRIDGTLRANAEASVDDKVTIKKVECSPATAITLAPLQQVRFTRDPTEFFLQRLLDVPLIKGQRITFSVMGTQLHYITTKVAPKGCVKVTQQTNLTLAEKGAEQEISSLPEVSYEDIGGLRKEVEMIREMVELPMKHPEVFERLGIGAPNGVLLTGPPGTGKTLLAKAVANETDSEFFSINGPEIMSKFHGESEQKVREIFEEANKKAPSIIFIDEIDSIAPKRGEGAAQAEKRIVAQLLTLMDGLRTRGNVVVIAATNRPDDIDEALRRPGRFDREIRILPPDEDGRKEILQIHTRGMPLAKDVELDLIAAKTIGFTGADINALCKEAALKALKPYVPSLNKYSVKVPTNVLEKIIVTMENFSSALNMVEPSALREVLIKKPKIKWSDIGGLEEVKERLRETIELPLKRPELFKEAGISPPKGVLLSGPPGTGKTLLAKAIAGESNANFISVKGPELISKWVGESEKHIREIFKKARLVAPTVIFFDEFDSISKVRGMSLTDSTERMVNQLLTEIDGVEELGKVTIIAATNRSDLIDPALLRPGRIELKIEIPLPDEAARKEIFKVHTKAMPIEKELPIEKFAQQTENWSGAEIESLCREAGLIAIRETATKLGKNETNTKTTNTKETKVKITTKHFTQAFKIIKEREKKEEKANENTIAH